MQDLIDIKQFQMLQDRLNEIYSFPSAIIDNDGNILTATAWQDICTQFHRQNKECEQECIKSDQYIISHLAEAHPAVSYRCPHGLVDNATPIIIDGVHYGNFFTGQFFMEPSDLEFFKQQAQRYGFDEQAYLAAVRRVPIWTQEQLNSYLFFIKGLIEVISSIGLKNLQEVEARRKIEETEERANTILRQMHDGFWVVDMEGRILDVNPAMCQLTGYNRGELLTMSIADVDMNDSPADVARRIQHIAQNGSAQFETQFRCKDGRIIEVDISVTHLPDRHAFFGFHRGITERKRAEKQLLRAQKLESLGILAGGVAHDFNNLLVALLGQTSLAAAKLPPEHPAQRHLERAVIAAKRAADLTRQMLAYSGHGAFQMAPLNLNSLIRDNAAFLESSISKSIALLTELNEALPLINADAGQMQQIIMNLVLNAAEAIGDHTGSISLTTSVIDVAAGDDHWIHYTGQAVAAGRYVQLRVQDTGSGMNAETLRRIFDPFFTTKATGRGLGLSAIQGIVRGHRGGLWVDSEVGLGTVFTLIFPVTAATSDTPRMIASQMTSTQRLVLVIDDEEAVREAITDMLALDNIATLCAATGAEGIDLFHERHADIGLVLLDLSMPELNGRETFDRLWQIEPLAHVMLSSGYTQAEAMRDFEGRPLAGFLHKPYDMETLLETVRLHLTK